MMYKHFNQSAKKAKGGSTRAAVIRYDKDNDRAPVVVAQGQGDVAQKIITKAKEHDIPLQENAFLLENLLELDLGNHVPPQLYQVIAEVLLLVRRANVGDMLSSHPVLTLQHTPYWEDEAEIENEEVDITIDDLLQSIRNI